MNEHNGCSMDIRALTPADATGAGHVAFETAFFGKSAEAFFPDRTLFTDLWLGPYLQEPSGFVAEAKGEILGYILGADEQQSYRKKFLRLTPFYLKRLITGTYPQWRRCLPYLLRVMRYPAKHAPFATYPAHLHINLLPQARGKGLGKQLLATYLGHLEQKNIKGVQLSTTRENVAAVKLYESFGFSVWCEYESPLWRPWHGHSVTHLVMVKLLA